MASSSGNSSGSTQIQNSGSGEESQVVVVVDQRKRKRMLSNRESARRSRMRKQKHLNDLMEQVAQLRKENNQILTSVSVTTQQFLTVEAQNSVLRAQMGELSQRLQSLNDILSYMNTNADGFVETQDFYGTGNSDGLMMNNSWNLMYQNQPIMAAAEMFQY